MEDPIDLDQHYGGAKPPCMPHCDTKKKPLYKVEVVGMHADGIPKADLGPHLNGTANPNSIVLTVSDSDFTTAHGGKPASWRCENARINARNVLPMPGTCPKKTEQLRQIATAHSSYSAT